MESKKIGEKICFLMMSIALLVSGFLSIAEIFKSIKFYLINGTLYLKTILDVFGKTQYIGLNNILDIVPVFFVLLTLCFISFVSLISSEEKPVEDGIPVAFGIIIFSLLIGLA